MCIIKLPSYLFGENHYYYNGEKLDDKFDDELGDQFNESPIIVTNIVIKRLRNFAKLIG